MLETECARGARRSCEKTTVCRESAHSAPEGRVVHVDGVLVEADAAFAEMFGFTDPEEAIGTLLFDLVAPDARGGAVLGVSTT